MKKQKKIIYALLVLFVLSLISPILIPVSSISEAATIQLNSKSTTIYVGATTKLKVSGTTSKITWISSNSKIASVSSKGEVKALKVGKSTISAKVSGKTMKCTVIVKNAPASASDLLFGMDDGDFIIEETSAVISFTLNANSTGVKVSIYNSADEEVYTKVIDKVAAKKKYTFNWDGKDNNGNYVVADVYTVKVNAGDVITAGTDILIASLQTDFTSGNGSKDNPYIVSNQEQFVNIAKHNGKYYKQTGNIDFGYKELIPMFSETSPFCGNYDGDNNSISNIIMNSTNEKIGMIVAVSKEGSINNLKIDNFNVSGTEWVAGLVCMNYGSLSNVKITNAVISAQGSNTIWAGILCVGNYTGGIVKNCSVSGTVSGVSSSIVYAGGIIAYNQGTVMNSTAIGMNVKANVSTYWEDCYAGGLIAQNDGIVMACTGDGNVAASQRYDDEYVSGVCTINNGQVNKCSFTGTYSGKNSDTISIINKGVVTY